MSLHLEHLNPEQLAAVTLPDEHALILAGAGSGKTRVLTTRIAWLVKGGRVSPAGDTRPPFTSQAMRVVSTRVLPLPAPARMSACSSGRVTAASCSGLRCSR